MGTWSPDMLGSDTASDILFVLSKQVGYNGDEDDLYTFLTQPQDKAILAKAAQRLTQNEFAILRHKWFDDVEVWPVISCAYIGTGAFLPPVIKQRAIRDCKKEIADLENIGWNDNGVERKKVLEDLISKLENYNGTPVKIDHIGLFEKILGDL